MMDEFKHESGEIPETASVGGGSNFVRTSRLAIIACVLAIVSLLLLPGLIRISVARHGRKPLLVHQVYVYVTFAVSVSAVVLTVASVARIALSGGRLTGRGLAWTSVSVMALQVLFFLLLPVLARTRCVAFRMTCGTNLAVIGKASFIYANDYEDELPRAGGRDTVWASHTPDWAAPSRNKAFDLAADGTGGMASTSASLYLLIKYSEVIPERFVCSGTDRKTWEKGIEPFRLDMYNVPAQNADLIDFWDFGPDPTRHISYSYHMPYGMYALTTSNEPGLAVAADRNPWMDSPSAKAKAFAGFRPDVPPFNGTAEQAKHGNTFRHDGDGQNVLFLDSHVEFAKRAYCSVGDDNIYTISNSPTGGDPLGTPPKLGSQPANRRDSLLVNDPPSLGQKLR
jgi:prepilin-type processing-associated H-X9-DG protein